MLRGLHSAILLALTVEGQGQNLRSWSGGLSYSSEGGFSSWTSNFFKRSTWTRDEYGHTHHQVQESHTKSVSSDDGVQRLASHTVCKDGLCREETVHAVQASPTSSVGWPQRMPAGIHAMMEHLIDSPRLMEPRPQAPPSMPFRVGIVVPAKPMLIVQLRPALRGSHPIALTDGETQPSPEARVAPHGHNDPTMQEFKMMAGFYLALVASILGSFLILSKCVGKAEAREPQIRTLAEPLAPVEETAALPAAAPRQVMIPAPTPTQKYLLDVYARAQENVDLSIANAERKGIQQYLCELYGRVA